MKKYLIGMGESRVLINKNELNIKGEFDILVLKDSKMCRISNIKANEIYLFNSHWNLINRNTISRIFINGDCNSIIGNTTVGNIVDIGDSNNIINTLK